METTRLIGVGICTLLAGVLGSGITAFVTARNSRKQREEDRFIWKREKVLELVTATLEAGREIDVVAYTAIRKKLYPGSKELWDFKQTMYRLSEHFLIMDSGIVANHGWQVTMIEIHRLNALDHEMGGSELEKSLEDWSVECRRVRNHLMAAMRIDLGDPEADPKEHRKEKKAFSALPPLVEPEQMTPNFYTQSGKSASQKDLNPDG